MNLKKIVLFLFFAGSVLSKIYSLGSKPLWFDELTSLTGAILVLPFWEKLSVAFGDLWGMLYASFLIHFHLPVTPFTLRLPYALLGGMVAPLVYLLAPKKDRFFFALFFTIAPYTHYFSQESRPYIGNLIAGAFVWLNFFRWVRGEVLSSRALLRMLFLFFLFGASSPFLFLGAGVPAFYLVYKSKNRFLLLSFLFGGILYMVYFLHWFRFVDVSWFRDLGFRFEGINGDLFLYLFSWLLLVPEGGVGIGFLFLFLGFLSFPDRKKILSFVFFLTCFLYSFFFPLTNHPVEFRYFASFFPATIFLVLKGVVWFLNALFEFFPFYVKRIFLTVLLSGFMGYLYCSFYLPYFRSPLKPTMMTSLSASFYLHKIPFPEGNTIYVSGVTFPEQFFVSSAHYRYLILPEILSLPFLYTHLRNKDWIFLGGKRDQGVYRIGGRNGFERVEEGVRKRGISFRICYEEEWELCFPKKGKVEIYIDTFFLLPHTDYPPCFFIHNNPCKEGFSFPWEERWTKEIPICVPTDFKKRFGTALYLRFSSLRGEERTKILQFRCYR